MQDAVHTCSQGGKEHAMNHADWDDLRLFFHVATEGGLSGAAERTGLSAPTIGRRMLALERTMGRALFIRSQQGYRLAPDGEVLIEHVRTMRQAAESIADWHGNAFSLPIVSVACHGWISGFIADHVLEIRGPQDALRLCCKHIDKTLDLTFREADIAVVGERPKTGNFAVLRSVSVAYAAYRRADVPEREAAPWISIGTQDASSPAERWVFQNHESETHTWTNSPVVLPRLIAAGAGRGVLPAFLGDANPRLLRDGEILEELTHPLWIVFNDDDRHRPEMRLVIDRLAALFNREEGLFSGVSAELQTRTPSFTR
jgi:DNA-binding transcriptional LysR family regulator